MYLSILEGGLSTSVFYLVPVRFPAGTPVSLSNQRLGGAWDIGRQN